MNDLYDAQQKRIQATENAARQAELEAEQAAATRALLKLLFKEQELQAIIDDPNTSEEDRALAQEELDYELAEKERIETEKEAARIEKEAKLEEQAILAEEERIAREDQQVAQQEERDLYIE
jgi:hypothetical protein